MDQDIAAPAVLEGGAEVPLPARLILEPVEQNHMMTPGQFCSKLQNFGVGPGLGKGPHVAEVAGAEALDTGKLRPQILRQPVYHLGSPALSREPGGEILPNRPVE